MELLTWFATSLDVSCKEKRNVIGKKKKKTKNSHRRVWTHYANLSSEELMCCYLWGYKGNRTREQEVHGDTFMSPSNGQTRHCANGDFPSSLWNTESVSVWAKYGLNCFIRSMRNSVCVYVCFCVQNSCKLYLSVLYLFVAIHWWLRLYLYIYDSFSEFVHFAVFVCGCTHVRVFACVYLCGCACIQECMRALWQVYSPLFVWVGEIFVSIIPLHGPGWTWAVEPRLRWKTQLASTAHVWLHSYRFFSFLSTLLHHWCGSESEAPGQIQFLDVSSWTRLIQLKALNNWANGETEALPRGKCVTS